MTRARTLVICLLAASPACNQDPAPATPDPPDKLEPEILPGYPSPSAACRGPEPEPTHLVVTSTDFNTGAVGLVELAGSIFVQADLALASSDAVAKVVGERVFVVNRFGFDYIDELDPREDLALIHEWAVIGSAGPDAPSTNPQSLSLGPAGDAWVSLHGAGELIRYRFPELIGATVEAALALDLSSFADGDQNPELGLTIACGELLFVSAERIDREDWVPADETLLIPVDLADPDAPALHDFDPDHPGGDGIALLGAGVGPWRLDPEDPAGHTILLLNSGLERVDLAAGSSAWVVDEQVFAALGLTRLHLSGFDLDGAGRMWIAGASADYSRFTIYRVEPGASPSEAALIPEIEDLQSVTGALEIVGDELWFADTRLEGAGLRVFDVGAAPPIESPGSPYLVGLAPMNLTPLRLAD